MLDAYIIERLEREKERARSEEKRIPLSIEPPPLAPPPSTDIDHPREEQHERPKRGVVVIDFSV